MFGFSISDIGIERRSENRMVNEEKISVGIGPFSIEDTETKPINRNGEQTGPSEKKQRLKW